MEYRIVLQRMEFRALHGCYELERKVGNRFTVDLEITACLGDAAAEDSGMWSACATKPPQTC